MYINIQTTQWRYSSRRSKTRALLAASSSRFMLYTIYGVYTRHILSMGCTRDMALFGQCLRETSWHYYVYLHKRRDVMSMLMRGVMFDERRHVDKRRDGVSMFDKRRDV